MRSPEARKENREMFCALHDTYTPGCSLCVKKDRIASAYSRAFSNVQEAAEIMSKGWPHGNLDKLKATAESLNAYLAELKR